ncbi:MAG: GFA family protein [Deltaproteobacteria bacterium]|nr:GFA family protein [Deltaproteobacteria bacterium]
MNRIIQPIPGTCLCGRVQFTITPPTDFCAHCHCESCRLAHGSPVVTWTSVPLGQFKLISGQTSLKWYASSEWVEWGFCVECGSSMFYRAVKEGHPEKPRTNVMYVAVGNLTGALDKSPSDRYSCEEEVTWFHGIETLPRYCGKTNKRL